MNASPFFLFFSTVIGVLTAFSVQAQGVWTLEACIQYANENNLVIQQAAQSNQINEINWKQSKAMLLPSLSANVSAGRTWGRSFNSVNLQLVDGAYNTSSFSANMNMPLFNGLSTQNTIKQNRLLAESGQLDLQATQEDYHILIAQSYLQVLELKEQIKNTANQLLSSAEELKNTRLKQEQGLVAEYNVLQLESQLAQEERDQEELEGQLRIAKINLMQLMDLEVSDAFEVATAETLTNEIVLEAPGDIDQIYFTSVSQRPAVKSAELQTKSKELDIQLARAGMMPSLDLNASVSSNYSSATDFVDFSTTTQESAIGYLESDPSQTVLAEEEVTVPIVSDYSLWDQFDDNLNTYVGVTLSIPIFSNKKNSSQVQIAKVNTQIAKLEERDTKNQLRKDIEQAHADVENAISQYKASQKQLELSERLFENAQYSHEAGLISTTDFTIEKNNLLNAQNSMILAKYQYLFSDMILDFYKGEPLGF